VRIDDWRVGLDGVRVALNAPEAGVAVAVRIPELGLDLAGVTDDAGDWHDGPRDASAFPRPRRAEKGTRGTRPRRRLLQAVGSRVGRGASGAHEP
jgi:hypothetical protein